MLRQFLLQGNLFLRGIYHYSMGRAIMEAVKRRPRKSGDGSMSPAVNAGAEERLYVSGDQCKKRQKRQITTPLSLGRVSASHIYKEQ